ncbi:hypothetical protein [Streptomyces griseus]|uniref:hypothetical protein n=1 Tax=Streptomyces griseus TaxID=1911 RepID=UPI0005699220|nr:hypothetical protein [Streptomyces griseus]
MDTDRHRRRVIAGGVALAFFTAGLASGAAVAAADAVIEFGATLGVAVTATVAEIAAGALVAAAFGGVESIAVDLAVAQPLKIATGLQDGLSLDEVNQAAKDGMLFGGVLGGGAGVLKAGMEGLGDTTPLLLRRRPFAPTWSTSARPPATPNAPPAWANRSTWRPARC